MKRFVSLLFVLLIIPSIVLSDLPDISSLSFDELVQLRHQVDLSIWDCNEWRQVKVPIGVYIIGIDIPAGHWTLKPPAGDSVTIEYFKNADETGKRPASSLDNYDAEVIADENSSYASFIHMREVDFELKDGFYLSIVNGPYVIFEPYISKPAFSFFE